MTGEILQRIAELSEAATARGPWGFLAPVANVRRLPFADSAAIDELREEFTPEQLEDALLLVRRGDSQIGLNPILAGEAAQGLFLRRKKGDMPFDIVNQNGSLATDAPPVFGCIRDFFTKRFSGDAKSVIVTSSDEDLAVLRMLSLPCTPAAGLATMTGERLRSLFADAPGFPHSASIQGQAGSMLPVSYQLVLAAWGVAELKDKQPGGVASIVACLLKAEDTFGFDTAHRVGIWRPDAREFNRIRSAAEFQDRVLVRNLIWQSIARSTCSARQFEEETATRAAADYEAARRDLLHTLKRAKELGFQSSQVAKRLEAFNRSFDRSVVDAIICDAMSASDSVDRALLLAASDLMGHWHRSSSLVRSTESSVSGRFHPRDENLHPEDLKERLRVVDGLVKIHRELTRNK